MKFLDKVFGKKKPDYRSPIKEMRKREWVDVEYTGKDFLTPLHYEYIKEIQKTENIQTIWERQEYIINTILN